MQSIHEFPVWRLFFETNNFGITKFILSTVVIKTWPLRFVCVLLLFTHFFRHVCWTTGRYGNIKVLVDSKGWIRENIEGGMEPEICMDKDLEAWRLSR